jgi:pimeloyl-ACP methyl ester carboxylesterase
MARKRMIGRIIAGIVALSVLLLGLGASYEQHARRVAAQDFPPTGRLVDIGGRRIHLDCRGNGLPIVILEAGADTSGSALWYPVMDSIARQTRVCSYDRAGLMWSDPGPSPRDGEAIVSDLNKALTTTREHGPYVMVGASLGGPLTLLFTKHFGDAVAGLVLVDAAHPDQIRRLEEASGVKDDPAPLAFRVLANVAWTGLPRLLLPSPELPELPQRVADAINAYQVPSLGPALNEAIAMPKTLQQAGAARNLGDRPLAILSHGKPWSAYTQAQQASAGMNKAQFERHQAAWARMQAEETGWSSDSSHRTLIDSSHVIQLERPDAVIAAITEVIRKVRSRQHERAKLPAARSGS